MSTVNPFLKSERNQTKLTNPVRKVLMLIVPGTMVRKAIMQIKIGSPGYGKRKVGKCYHPLK